ncbi:MAG: hypothetical protein KIT83_14035 [Bryobacterales bacterium]|nr:hypothetical protein [Bryobacterales bacterium]
MSRIDFSSGWALAAGLSVGLLLAPVRAGIFALPAQDWWPGVCLAVGAGTVVAYGSHWVVSRWLDAAVLTSCEGVLPATLVALTFGCVLAVTQNVSAISLTSLLLATVLVGALIWMLAVDGSAKSTSFPLLGATFSFGLAQLITGAGEAPMAAPVVAGAIVATTLPQPTARVRPIPFWSQSAVVLFIGSEAALQGAWVALALAAITAVGLSLLLWSFGFVRRSQSMPVWSYWVSAGLVLGSASVAAALHGANTPLALGLGLSVLAAVALLCIAAARDLVAAPSLASAPAARRAGVSQAWSRKQLAREIESANSCQKLWHLVRRSHSSTGLVSVKWQLPGLCFETSSQEPDPEKQWTISIPLAPSAWIEAAWDPSLKGSLSEATSYLKPIAERASTLTYQHIETLFDDCVDSDEAV